MHTQPIDDVEQRQHAVVQLLATALRRQQQKLSEKTANTLAEPPFLDRTVREVPHGD